MSGTSLDGLDIALCSFTGAGLDTNIELLRFETIPYNDHFKKEVKSVFSKRNVDLEKVCLLNEWIAVQHGNMINECLRNWGISNSDIDVIASHGQTIYHAPKSLHGLAEFGNGTLQIGDGDHLAVTTKIIVISDFRQKHIAAGGEGAPLAVYGDYVIFSKKDEDRIMLNIGGISNFTWLPGNLKVDEIFSTDIGPGNTLMDAYVQQNFTGEYFDKDAAIAKQGTVNEALLQALKQHPFFEQGFPKTTGPELFNLTYLNNVIEAASIVEILHEDVMATLNKFTADVIVNALQRGVLSPQNVAIYPSGGGMHNPLLMQHIKQQLPHFNFKNTNELSVHPDAKEAVLFAVLANETLSASTVFKSSSNTGIPNVTMGKISLPG